MTDLMSRRSSAADAIWYTHNGLPTFVPFSKLISRPPDAACVVRVGGMCFEVM